MFGVSGEDGFESVSQFAARKHHLVPAFDAFQANVGAKAHHAPLVTAAGMRFTQFHPITDVELW